MNSDIKISYGKPYPLGATVIGENAVNFAVVINSDDPCGVLLYNRKSKNVRKLSFCCSNKVGNIRCMKVEGIDIDECEYNFYLNDEIIFDPYSKKVLGNEKWGVLATNLRSGLYKDDYDWENDKHPLVPYNEAVIYCLHVRGFTKHTSSNVKNPGTYYAITQKIDYFKSLGITTLELMPAYNFIEFEQSKKPKDEYELLPYEDNVPKLNYWGYKNSFYFAPKTSYSPRNINADIAFKDMVKALHAAGIEVIMQFFFPADIKQGYIYEVLKFWMQEYHVDGFHLMGSKLPLALLGTEPMLANTKLMSDAIPLEDIYGRNEKPNYKNIALCKDEYMYNLRRFIKSDEGMVPCILQYIREIPDKHADVHFVSHGNTFTLMDVVSYDRKHNEANGENNRDGAIYNGSWNCGAEGPTNKKTIKNLRLKQIKNAIVLNMISKSTPLITAGDEFGNSQQGNNNPYCQDNTITWLNWKNLDKNNEIFEFTKQMIDIRKRFGVLHSDKSFTMSDVKQLGYPDLSFHSEEPWVVDTDPLSRQFGILYNGNYCDGDYYLFVAVNMHWTSHAFAIPKINGDYDYSVLVNTDSGFNIKNLSSKREITVKERSIVMMLINKK